MKVPFVDLRRTHTPLLREMQTALRQIVQSNNYILGDAVAHCEAAFAKEMGVPYAVGVASGTDALHLSLRAVGINPGDEVLVPTMTFAATALAVLYAGATPVLVDVQEEDALIDLRAAERALSHRTKAIIPVHLYGKPCQMKRLMEFAGAHGLRVIEDACQAHGATFAGKAAGTFGDTGCFSFYPSKNLGALGDGGMIVTQDKTIHDRLVKLRNYGQRVKYHHETLGFNSRLDSLQAAFVSLKIPKLKMWNKRRRAHAAAYSKGLKGLPIGLPYAPEAGVEPIYHLYVIHSDRRDELQAYLGERGIETGIHYPFPIHRLEFMQSFGFPPERFPVAERWAGQILSLPMFPELTAKETTYVIQQVRSFFTP